MIKSIFIKINLKKKTIVYFLSYFAFCFFQAECYSLTNGQDALNSPVGTLLAHLNLGVAANGDSSIADINPALLAAIEKQYAILGNLNFHSGFALYEIGVLDTTFTPVRALFKVRQTTTYTSEIDRRFELALAYQIPQTRLSLGLTGYYDEYGLHKWLNPKQSTVYLAVGALYQIDFKKSEPLFIGASITNLLNKFQKTFYNLGVSKAFAKNLYRIHLDGAIQSLEALPVIAGGIDITIKKYFILSGSAGWNFNMHKAPLGAGLYFNGPRLKLFYSLASNQVQIDGLWHSAGLAIAF